MLALYAGSFDPITFGHLDVIQRALRVFDRVEVTVAINTSKKPLFSIDERCALIRQCTAGLEGVSVVPFEGLLIDHARARKAAALVRGLRVISDFDYEMRMAFANRRLAPEIETLFFPPAEDQVFVSASLVREIHQWGGDLSSFVPEPVRAALVARQKDANG